MQNDLVEKIKKAGIVGAGGAGFPTHIKVDAKAEQVVVNGAECEPLLRVDQQLMVDEIDTFLQGLQAVIDGTGAKEGIIALKGKYKKAIAALEEAIKDRPKIKLHILGDFYPAGDEHVTVYEATGKVIPQGGIPLKVGCVVNNVETLYNVGRALNGEPVVDTYITLTGEVPEPITVKVPIGSSIREVLALAGLTDLSGKQIIEGGPMMGPLVDDFDRPVTKTSKGLIVLAENHPLIQRRMMDFENILKQAKAACIQCRRCTDLCPRNLLGHDLQPHALMRAMNYTQASPEVLKMAFLCTECGACEFACNVMNLSPRRVNGFLKKQLAAQGIRPGECKAETIPNSLRENMKIPIKRLIANLGLTAYNVDAPIVEKAYKPKQVVIPLQQHVGMPAEPIVTRDQKVERGDVIAQMPEGKMGADVHASISGVVKEIGDSIIIESNGGVA